MDIQIPDNLTVDGIDYPVSSFSEQVQLLVFIHTTWRNDLQKERLASTKTEAAIRSLDAELAQLVGSELAARAETAEKATPTEE